MIRQVPPAFRASAAPRYDAGTRFNAWQNAGLSPDGQMPPTAAYNGIGHARHYTGIDGIAGISPLYLRQYTD